MDFSTGSVGIGATATLWSALAQRYVAGHFDVPQGGRQVALVGDAELDEGAIWEALVDPMVAAARRGAVDRRPQPAVARPRRARHGGRPPRGDVRGGRLGDDHRQVRAAAARAVRARRRRVAARADRLDEQRGVPAAAAHARRRAARAAPGRGSRAARRRAPDRRPRRRRGRGRGRRPRWARPRRPARGVPPRGRGARPPGRHLRVHDQGHGAADAGASRPTTPR